jgi:4-hydroxy-tetrahydrodipicolinate synthase
MQSFFGTGVALVTPFKTDFSVDFSALEKLVHFVIENGVNYLVVLGTTGEPATLSELEKEAVIETIVKANNKRVPMVLGVGGNNTSAVESELKTRDFKDFDAILSVSPYYNKPTQEGIYQHFAAVSKASPLPLILYNVPGRTGSNMLPETVLRLARDFENIIGIKEAAGDMVQALKLLQNKPKNFLIISGDDMIALPMVLAGGAGVISVIGEGYPKQFSKMIQLGLEGKASEAYEIQYKLMDSIDMIFEQGNPAGVKEIHKKLGLSENTVRLPLVAVNQDLQTRIHDFTDNFLK